MTDRNKTLGASEAAAAIGLSKWRTPLALYAQKIGDAPPTPDSLPMQVGRALEPVVLRALIDERGCTLQDQQRRFVDPALPWRTCTVDAITAAGELVEAKTAGSALGWGADGTDQVPTDYIVQVQHSMAVTGLRVALIPVLLAGRIFRVYEVARDDWLIEAITERECVFWRCVEARTPPEITTLADAAIRWPHDTGRVLTATDGLLEAAERLRALKAEAKAREADMDALELEIKTAMADATTLAAPDGRALATWKSQSARRFSSSDFKAAHADLYEAFRHETHSRVFRLK